MRAALDTAGRKAGPPNESMASRTCAFERAEVAGRGPDTRTSPPRLGPSRARGASWGGWARPADMSEGVRRRVMSLRNARFSCKDDSLRLKDLLGPVTRAKKMEVKTTFH